MTTDEAMSEARAYLSREVSSEDIDQIQLLRCMQRIANLPDDKLKELLAGLGVPLSEAKGKPGITGLGLRLRLNNWLKSERRKLVAERTNPAAGEG